MNQISIIKEIENNCDVNSIVSGQLPIWQYIRNLIYSQDNYNKNRSTKLKDFYCLARNYNWGNYKSSKNYKYLLFTDSNEEIVNNKQHVDKTSQNLINLTKDNLMVIVNPVGKVHRPSVEYKYNHMSSSFFHYRRWIFGLTKSKKIENLKDLEQILKKYNINLDINYLNRLFFTYVDIFLDWLTKTSPKAVFINCYYSLFHQALIFACKKKKIKTIEIQHGLISDSHNQYSPEKFIGKHTMPDYLMCYNDYVKDLINENYINEEKIIPIGHYYVEKKLNEKTNQEQSELNQYSRVVAVSTQNDLEKELLEKIEKIAAIKSDILFIVKTRYSKSLNSKYKNIKINNEIDIYSLIKQANLHITCYSTVALESSMMGTPSILININNMSKLYYDSIVKKFENIKICDSNNEVLNAIDNWKPKNTNKKPYILNNKKNIKQFLDTHIK